MPSSSHQPFTKMNTTSLPAMFAPAVACINTHMICRDYVKQLLLFKQSHTWILHLCFLQERTETGRGTPTVPQVHAANRGSQPLPHITVKSTWGSISDIPGASVRRAPRPSLEMFERIPQVYQGAHVPSISADVQLTHPLPPKHLRDLTSRCCRPSILQAYGVSFTARYRPRRLPTHQSE